MRGRDSQRGSSLPETAIVMSALLAVMFGIVDFGRALYTYSFVTTAAREGARWAAVRGANCIQLDHCPAQQADLVSYVQGLSEGATDKSQIAAALSYPSCPTGVTSATGNAPGCVARVTVTYPFKFAAPFVSTATITMSSSSEMVISQ